MGTAICVDQLSKCYKLGEVQRYKALRDSITNAVTAPFRTSRKPTPKNLLWALKDVCLEITHGEVVGLIGRNGAGKSTLLKILSRIVEPTSGYARIYGRVGSLLEVGTGFHPELTGRENIYLSGAILGMRKKEIDHNFDAIVDFAEVSQFLDTPIKFYSSGMYVRLAFAVAAHLEPEILLVDEVLAVGDAAFQKKCLGKMGDVARTGRTVIFVSHNMAAIQNLCTVGHLLSRGTVVASGPIADVVDRYLKDATEAQHESLSERSDRQGNGKLVFTEFTATGANGNVVLASGLPAELTIGYRGTTPLRAIHISIGLYNAYGEGVLYLSNDLVGTELTDVPANGHFLCRFDRLPVLPGAYSVNLYCTVNGIMADWVRNAARVNVESGDFYGTGKLPPPGYGAVVVPHEWAIR